MAGAGEDNMGGAAALIPGIVGIAGGEYAGYKKRQGEEEMLRNRIASAGRFLGEEQQPQRNSMGVPAPNIEQRDPLAPGIGGESTRRALDERSYSGMARKFALEQAINGNVGPLNDMTKARMTPVDRDYGNSPQKGIDPKTNRPGLFIIDKNSGDQIWLGVEPIAEAAAVLTPDVQTYNAYLKAYGGNPILASQAMKRDAAIAGRAGESEGPKVPSLKIYNYKGQQIPLDMNNVEDIQKAKDLISQGANEGQIVRPTQMDYNNDRSTLESAQINLDTLAAAAAELYTAPGLPAITGKRSLNPTLPNTEAAAAEAKLKTVISKSALDTLTALKSAGSTLGAVSEAELELLKDNITSLDQKMKTEDFQKAVEIIINRAGSLKQQTENKFRDKYQLADSAVPRTVTPFAVGGNKRRIEVLPRQMNLNSRYGL